MKHFCGLGTLFRETAFSPLLNRSKKFYQNKGLIHKGQITTLNHTIFKQKRIKEICHDSINITRLEVTSMIQNYTTHLSGQCCKLVWHLLRLQCTFHSSFSNTVNVLNGQRKRGGGESNTQLAVAQQQWKERNETKGKAFT